MIYLIISDIHGNFIALKEALKVAEKYNWEEVLILGDVVGYYPYPNKVVKEVKKLLNKNKYYKDAIIRGNHDKVCSGIDEGYTFNNNAYRSAMWTKEFLKPENRNFLYELPKGPKKINDLITICHGSPMDEDYYILYEQDAFASFYSVETQFCFFGHTHIPGLFKLDTKSSFFTYFIPKDTSFFKLNMDKRYKYLINPGSVGQPRDNNPNAAFVIFDSDRGLLFFHRIPYDIEKVVKKVQRDNLPIFLAERLKTGV